MFNRIRMQLTIRNAAVLFVILIALNVSVYWVMKGMLFAQIDRSLLAMKEANTPSAAAGSTSSVIGPTGYVSELGVPAQKPVVFGIAQTDRPIILLFWTADDQPLPTIVSREFGDKELAALRPSRFGTKPSTVKIGDQRFRVLTFDSAAESTVAYGNGTMTYRVDKQQLLTNVSAEFGMLQRLLYILLFGGLVGLLVAIAAGYYLANRALVPIRLSMEKQQQFVSDASHELRTPLSVIQAHAELLLRHPERTIEQDSKHVSTVLQEARRMSKLVGGLLTLARSDSNQLELDAKPVRLDRIVRDGVDKMQMLAEVKEIILHAEVDANIELQADEDRLQQLLAALLDNALKYTPEGGVVRVVCRKLTHSAQLEVEDTGIGIAPEHLPHVFDRFYRADKSRSREEGGTGLGLAIAKWIVERHGGKIRMESKPSVGTRVIVSLPT